MNHQGNRDNRIAPKILKMIFISLREGNDADTLSLVRRLTGGNWFHEYFIGFGRIFPHVHNPFVLLEMTRFESLERSNLKECDIVLQRVASFK